MNEERIKSEFLRLTALDSVSLKEWKILGILRKKLENIGFCIEEDGAAEKIGGEANNLYGFLKGSLPGEPILFSAHMDTVQPGIGKKPIFHEDGRITSDGTTVLGADDVAGLVEILEGIRSIREEGIPHRDIEVVFSACEEFYCKGVTAFDFGMVKAKEAYVLDLSGPIGSAAYKAPSILSFTMEVKGKPAHAGFEPEKGIHAIALMCQVIAKIKQGRLDEETTLNIGTISGGTMSNIVPERCVCHGEIRSYSHEKALQALENVKGILQEHVKDFSFDSQIHIEAYSIGKEEPVVGRFVRACEKLGLSGQLTETFGGSDNNVFAKHGIRGLVLSCGMYQVHSVEEYTTMEDLVMGAKLVRELILDLT